MPAISTRRTETEVELQDGQTFAVAGLMNNTVTSQMSKIPGIGDIPILGLLFQSKAARKDQTELVVMITPTILRRNSTGVSSTVPDMAEPFLPPLQKTLPPPAPWNRDLKPQPSTELAPCRAAPEPAAGAATAGGDRASAAASARAEPSGAGAPASAARGARNGCRHGSDAASGDEASGRRSAAGGATAQQAAASAKAAEKQTRR